MPDGKRQRDFETRFQQVVAGGFAGRVRAFDAAAALAYGEIMASRSMAACSRTSYVRRTQRHGNEADADAT